MSENHFPNEWVISSLDNVISSEGFISDGDWVESKDQNSDGSVRLIQLADIGDGEFKNKSERFMTPEKVVDLNCTYLAPDDVLVARMPDPLGRACIFPSVEQSAVTVVDVCIIRTANSSAIQSEVLKYWINSPFLRSVIAENASGTTRKRITRKKLEKFEIPIPPLTEQKVIAEKLDTLLAQVETTKARLESTLETLKQFRQSVLAAAVSGKLTDVYDFKTEPLDKLIEEMRNGLSPKPNEDGLGYPILRISSVRAMEVDTSDVRYLECDKLTKERYALKEDDLLFTRYNGSLDFVGVCGLFKVCKHETLLYPDKLIRVRTNTSKLLPKFAEIYFSSPEIRTLVTNFVKSTSGQKGISGKDLKSVVVKYPTTDEQIKIIDIVEKLFGGTDATEQKVNQALERVNNLTQSILAKAFRGELTEQWRKDNPELISGDNSAEAVLKKIKAEREAVKPKRKTRKKAE